MTATRPSLLSRSSVLAAAFLLGGCTVMEMRADNDRRERQVRDKEAELRQAQTAQSQLQAERQALLTDLKTRQLTIAELKVRLQSLQRLNTRSTAGTPEGARQKADRARQLDDAAAQVRALEQDPVAGEDAKARRLDEVRRQLRSTLELLTIT